MNRQMLSLLFATLVATRGALGAAPIQPVRFPAVLPTAEPLRLELSGRTGPVQTGLGGFMVIGLRLSGPEGATTRWLGIERARTLGYATVLAKDALEALRPYGSTMIVAGPADRLRALAGVEPGHDVILEGSLDRSSRVFFLQRVTVPEP